MEKHLVSRRAFLANVGGSGLAGALGTAGLGAVSSRAIASSALRGKADACIFIWLGGGSCHVDGDDALIGSL